MSDEHNTDKARFISRPNPLADGSYQIFEYKAGKDDYEPVGDYTLIDTAEDPDITAKKMMNLIALMNGKEPLVNFETLTNERVLFSINKDNREDGRQTIVFKTFKGEGVSKDNAVLSIEKGCIS
jgi:hypothetical protein